MSESDHYQMGMKDERDRNLKLLRASIQRLIAAKGYGWLTELDKLEAQVWKGSQEIPFAEEVEDEVTSVAG